MSYCRWQNTFRALEACANDMNARQRAESFPEEFEPEDLPGKLSADETEARASTLRLCAEMLGQLGFDIDGESLERAVAALSPRN